MKRREFIAFLGCIAQWPMATKAQTSSKVYRIGFITAGRGRNIKNFFEEALRALGWIEGKNLILEARFAEDRPGRLPQLIAELLRLNVDVLVAEGTLAPLAAKRATATIPIVMMAAGDPLGTGLVASPANPGGNVTGMSIMAPELAGKRLELLPEILPGLSRVAVLWNAANPYSTRVFGETEHVAAAL
jgi:putative ABC transport system substrate-binding protein